MTDQNDTDEPITRYAIGMRPTPQLPIDDVIRALRMMLVQTLLMVPDMACLEAAPLMPGGLVWFHIAMLGAAGSTGRKMLDFAHGFEEMLRHSGKVNGWTIATEITVTPTAEISSAELRDAWDMACVRKELALAILLELSDDAVAGLGDLAGGAHLVTEVQVAAHGAIATSRFEPQAGLPPRLRGAIGPTVTHSDVDVAVAAARDAALGYLSGAGHTHELVVVFVGGDDTPPEVNA